MIEELTHLPPNVVGFKASGEVKKEDYDKVIFPRIHDQMKHDEKLNYIFVIETPLKNFTGSEASPMLPGILSRGNIRDFRSPISRRRWNGWPIKIYYYDAGKDTDHPR